jgi:putative membrane protein
MALMLRYHLREVTMGWGYFGPGPWMFFGPVFFVVMIVACGVIMMVMMRGRHDGHSGALEILKERFARGEIDKVEYEERRRLLDI